MEFVKEADAVRSGLAELKFEAEVDAAEAACLVRDGIGGSHKVCIGHGSFGSSLLIVFTRSKSKSRDFVALTPFILKSRSAVKVTLSAAEPPTMEPLK